MPGTHVFASFQLWELFLLEKGWIFYAVSLLTSAWNQELVEPAAQK